MISIAFFLIGIIGWFYGRELEEIHERLDEIDRRAKGEAKEDTDQ